MFGFIKSMITGEAGRNTPEELERKKHVAAGVLLLEAARADYDCSEQEMEDVVATLKDRFALSQDCVADLLDLAHASRSQAVDIWEFTRHINLYFSTDEKKAIMEDVWRIILIDGKLDKYEDHFAHKLANMLCLSHQELIAAKLKIREQLAGKGRM